MTFFGQETSQDFSGKKRRSTFQKEREENNISSYISFSVVGFFMDDDMCHDKG